MRPLTPIRERPGWAIGLVASGIDPDTLRPVTVVSVSRRRSDVVWETYELTLDGRYAGGTLTAEILAYIDTVDVERPIR